MASRAFNLPASGAGGRANTAATQRQTRSGIEELYKQIAPKLATYLAVIGDLNPESTSNDILFDVIDALPADGGGESETVVEAFSRVRDHGGARTEPREPSNKHRTILSSTDFGDADRPSTALVPAAIHDLVLDLPSVQREVVILRLICELEWLEIARILNESVSTLKLAQKHGLLQLNRRR